LPLISDVIENIGTKKVFTKMDLRWGYNNVWIKVGYEWKATFTTPEGLFEPTVMFFRLMNSLVTFRTILNEILQNLIKNGKVVSFIDNIIIGTEGKKKHDELVEKLVKRLAENNLYIKPEKYKWKVREVGFLEVIIGLEGTKMEKEKVKDVLDWPTI